VKEFKKCISNSADETIRIAKEFAKDFNGGEVIHDYLKDE